MSGDSEVIEVRDAEELQRTHDMIVGILIGEAPMPGGEEARNHLMIAANVLCWVLEHDHNTKFAEFLEAIESALALQGFVLGKGRPST